MPASVEARRLIPTDSMSMPSAVRRTIHVISRPVTIQMMTGMGSVNSEPEPKKIRFGSLNVRIAPSVISCAIPRPATIRISVATIGWMPRKLTRMPFQSPQTRPATIAISKVLPRS